MAWLLLTLCPGDAWGVGIARKPVFSRTNRMERKFHYQTRKLREKCQGEKDVSWKICQDSEMSGASRIKRQWQHQTRMSRARNVKDKDFQEITESTIVPARRLGVVPIAVPCLYRLFPLSKLPSPGLPGLYLYLRPGGFGEGIKQDRTQPNSAI